MPAVVRLVDGRERRAAIDAGEPAGVAVGEDVDALARLLARGDRLDQLRPVHADGAVGLDVGVADLGGALVGGGDAPLARQVAHGGAHLVQRPAQVDGGRALLGEVADGAVERLVGGILAQRETDAVGRRGADQRRAAHLHGLDRAARVLQRLQA